MRCPYCQHRESRVIDSRASGDGIRRRRICEACGRRFTTMERVELHPPLVVKKDGRREAFDRDKLRTGFELACRKRPIETERLQAAVEGVERAILESGRRELPSSEIGRMVLGALRELDTVAYLRFASVYYELEAEAFLELLRAVIGDGDARGGGRA